MCVHNHQTWNCTQCCYPSVPTAWSQYQYPYNPCNPCTTNPCLPVSPCGVAPAAALPVNALSLLYATFVMTPTEFFAAPLAKYSIIPAPGAGYVIEPILTRAFLKVTQNPVVPVAYTDGVNPPVLQFSIGSNIVHSDSAILGGIVDQTRFYTVAPTLFTSTFENLPLEVGTDVLPIAGNGTLYIRVLYAIVPL